MSKEKQIEELTNELVFTSNYGTYNAVANYLVNKGYRKQSEGEWKTEDTILGKCCVCSVCGSCPTMEYKYCPYCGAKMKGESDD